MTFRTTLSFLIVVVACAFSGCGLPTSEDSASQTVPNSFLGSREMHVLIYSGPGSWVPEVNSLSKILRDHDVSYEQVDSEKLNSFSKSELAIFNLFIFPGGHAPTIYENLALHARSNLRELVKENGRGYLGFCAGAWLAADSHYDFGWTDSLTLEGTSMQRAGHDFALTNASFADGKSREMLWFGGPITPNLRRGVVARYADGTPAITQIRAGKGLVIVSGLHPAATPGILRSLGLSSGQAVAPEFAWELILAAAQGRLLPAF